MADSKFRIERDSLGIVEVPETAAWGPQTQRAVENFPVSGLSMPRAFIRALGLVKGAAAGANLDLGLLDEGRARAIEAAAAAVAGGQHDSQFPVDVFQTGSGTSSNMNANEVIAHLATETLGKDVHPNDHVNMSQSSNDVIPTCVHVSAALAIHQQLLPALEHLGGVLEARADELRDVVKTGRTHLMDATPLTLGQEFSGYVSQLDHGIKALKNTLDHLSELALGGTAVGTGLNTPKGYDVLVAKYISEFTGLPFKTAPNKFEALAAHDAIVETHGALKTLAVSLMKIGNDIRMLASGPRCGIGEIIIPANEPGSSIMPGKVNPTQAEALTMVCAQVIGNDAAITAGGMQGHFQLNVFKPVMIYNLLTAARLLGDACVSFNDNCAVGIEPNHPYIKKNLENSLMLVTALNTHIGYENAAAIAKKAHAEGTTLKEAALALELLTEEQFDEWVDPSKMIGPKS